PAFLPEPLGGSGKPAPAITPREAPGLESFLRGRLRPDACDLYAEAHRQVDRLLLPRVLAYTRGSYLKAAGLLGIARTTLRLKLREQGLLSSHRRWNREEEHINPQQRPGHRSNNGAGSRGCKDLAGRG